MYNMGYEIMSLDGLCNVEVYMAVNIWTVVLLFMTLYSVADGSNVLEQPAASNLRVVNLKVRCQVTVNGHFFQWPFIQFHNHFSQMVGLLARVISSSQVLYLNTGQYTE
jgi:hypothetical protein